MPRVPNSQIDLVTRIISLFETATSTCPACNSRMSTENAVHFKSLCRFDNEHWFEYDGLETPQCCFKSDLDKSNLYGANFFA